MNAERRQIESELIGTSLRFINIQEGQEPQQKGQRNWTATKTAQSIRTTTGKDKIEERHTTLNQTTRRKSQCFHGLLKWLCPIDQETRKDNLVRHNRLSINSY